MMHTDHLDLVSTYFNAHASDWHDYYHVVRGVNDLVLIDRTKIAVRFVEKYLSPPAKILDAGCGAGIASIDLVERGFAVHGMDIAEKMLEICAQNFSSRGIDPAKYLLTQGDLLGAGLPASSFDAIVALGFLQYQQDESQALRALWELLRPGGILVLSGPAKVKISNLFGVPNPIKRFARRRPGGAEAASADLQLLLSISVNAYSISRLRQLFEQAGLMMIDWKGHGYVHFRLIGRFLDFRRELLLHRMLTQVARVLPIERFANDLVVVGRKAERPR